MAAAAMVSAISPVAQAKLYDRSGITLTGDSAFRYVLRNKKRLSLIKAYHADKGRQTVYEYANRHAGVHCIVFFTDSARNASCILPGWLR